MTLPGRGGLGGGQEAGIGPHRYCVDEDLFLWRPRGEVLPEHARGAVAIVLSIYQQYGYVLYLLDGREAKQLGPETRRIIVDALRPMRASLAMAAFGLNGVSRISGILVFRAARLLTGLEFPFKFVASEAAARVFLSECREGLARRRSVTAAPQK